MANEKVKIILKKGFPEEIEIEDNGKKKKVQPKRIELSNGGKFIELEVGKAIEVPLSELQMWLNTGKVEQVEAKSETNPNGGNE